MNALRFTIACVALTLSAAACGSEGKQGPAGPAGPAGPQGPAGPVGDPPEILSVSPGAGSARTIWTIEGKNFAASPAGNTVWFDGEKATVLTATATKLTVTGAFTAVNGPEIRAVSVEAANQLSNAHSVWAFPSGTMRERGEKSFWSEARTFAPSADSVYVADAATGTVFRHDRMTRTIERIAQSERAGLGSVDRVFLGPMGEVWISERRSTPSGMVWRLLERENAGWSPILLMPGEPILAVPNDGANAWAVGTRTARRLNDGLAATLPADAFAAAISGDFLFVTHPATGTVSAIDAEGAVVDCGFVLPDPRGIVSLADGFVAIAADDGYHVATIGFADAAFDIPELSLPVGSVAQIERVMDDFFFSAPEVPRVMGIDVNGAFSAPAAGVRSPTTLARNVNETLVADLATCWQDPATGAFFGSLLAVKDDGAAREVSSTACVAAGLAVEGGGAGAVYADAFTNQVGRVDLATGTTSPIATVDDGIVAPVGIALGPNGEIFVSHFSANDGLAAIAKIDAAIDPAFALCPEADCFSLSVSVSGASLWMASSGSLWSADLANGGDWMERTNRALALFPQLDALEPDGADGLYLSDATTGTILLYTANAELVTASTGSEWSGVAGPLATHAATRDLDVGDTTPAGGRPLDAMLP